MDSLKESIDLSRLPSHVAVIMDGNGRWAKKNGKPRIFGHRNGVKSVREVTEAAAELGVSYLTLYAFSTDNWNRPRLEVNALMGLLVETLRQEIDTLNKNDIRLNAIGDLSKLPRKSYQALIEGIQNTKQNKRMVLTLALNYGGRWEITEAIKKISLECLKGRIDPHQIDESIVSDYLGTSRMPDPELMIRTSGEQRISNYLLWQFAYTELYFTPVFWPDFRKKDFYLALIDYQNRERRFGRISEQIV
jgi:undecaprenyl diphosphate synthase